MKRKGISLFYGIFLGMSILFPVVSEGQSDRLVIKKYLTDLPESQPANKTEKYRMTAVYLNRDLYGSFTGKIKVQGEYTRGIGEGKSVWNNVFISTSGKQGEPFPEGKRQEYMENLKYLPSSEVLTSGFFKDFPSDPESVYSKNLIWDMMMIENFARDYTDSLKLNIVYHIPDIKGEFEMADIGTYFHSDIQICWTGISAVNNKICAVIEYRAPDNKIELALDAIKTRGTEQYWGTSWVNLDTKFIEYALLYGGTIQEIEVKGINNKFLVKTIRELSVEKIR